MSSSEPFLSVVIPSWNGLDALRAHLPSVFEDARATGDAEVLVSDDGSDDETAASLASWFPDVRVVRRARRGGFAPAANDGVAASSGRIVALLNNDMDVRAGTFAALHAALEGEASAFAATPSILRARTGEDEANTRLRFRRGVVSTGIDGETRREPAYACGGAMAFRRDEFLSLGGFDPLYAPFYWEDVDLSYRARKRGRTILHVPAARVDHDHGRTIGARFDRAMVARVYERNRIVFTWKNITDRRLMRVHLLALPAKVVWDLLVHPAFVLGLRDALRLRGVLRERRAIERSEARVPDRDLLE